MDVTQRRINLADLRRIHDLTAQRFPHEYLDDRCPAILQTMTDELSLAMWPDVLAHFLELQSRLLPNVEDSSQLVA